MRTSVEISDSLMARVRKTMQRRQTTLRALVEEGLTRVVEEGQGTPASRLRQAAFPGPIGLRDPLQPSDLPELLRELRRSGRDGE
jgi:Arc/MetJ family transcription regulator